jgi:transcriptional regulator with XRE-family HTH domain
MPKIVTDGRAINFKRFGSNVRDQRRLRGWSIEMLAKRAGVAAHTVLRIEHGVPSTAAKRTRIASALDTLPARLEAEREIMREDLAIHTQQDDRWMSLIDYRPQVPEDNAERLQTTDERLRLGRLGFVPQFVKVLHCRLPKGKIVSGILELHGPLLPSTYLGGEVFAYALQGDSELHLGDEIFPLPEGYAATLDCTRPFYFAPMRSESERSGPTLVLYVRLDEIVPIQNRKAKRGQVVEGESRDWAASDEDLPPSARPPRSKRQR